MPDPRVAVVGVGHFGRHHARIWAEMAGVDLVGVVDRDAERAGEVARRHGVDVLPSLDVLPGLVDAVSVAVPTEHHLAVAGPLLDRGVHCLIEKPLAPGSAEGRELIERAKAGGATVSVGHVERFNPVVLAARKHEIVPMFIESHRIHPFSFRSVDVGVVLDIMIHDLDLILSLAGATPERVEAVRVPVLSRSEDICNARLTFPGGCVANVTASRVAMKTLRRLRVFSRDAYVSMDFGERRGVLYKKSPKLTAEYVENLRDDVKDLTDLRGMVFGNLLTVENLVFEEGSDPLTMELADFAAAIRENREPEVTGEDGLRAVELAERILAVSELDA